MRAMRLAVCAAFAVGFLTLAASAAADHNTRPSQNMQALGHSPNPASFLGVPAVDRKVNSDLAFWDNLVFNGNYDGFRILRRSPGNPRQITWERCRGDQGDIVVWDDILLRSYNAPAVAGSTCDGEPIPVGFEGFHVFDISDIRDPELVGSVELSARPMDQRGAEQDGFFPGCGSHTATLVPDLDNDRLLVYNQTSGGPCPFVSIIEVPLDDPGDARFLRNEPLMEAGAAHDSGAILGDVNKLAVASHDHANVYDIGENDTPGGSLEDPVFLYTITEDGVCNEPGNPLCNGNWHSAGFTWDGEVVVMGWEPGGGSAPECEATDPPVKKSAFFYDADTGEKLGQWTLPRPQTAEENCTIHNYNVVPTRDGYYLVVGNYQAGSYVVDFSDPSDPEMIGFSDPPALPRVPQGGTGPLIPELGGAWSTYFYNGYIYESEITKGVNVFRYTGRELRNAMRLDHLNPQTQEFSLAPPDRSSDNMRLLANLPKRDNATQSDLAFQGRYAYQGTYSGLRVIDTKNPRRPREVSFTPCNGGQFDVSVWRDLLFVSVDTPQTNDGCNAQNTNYTATPNAWEGVRVFDISEPDDPRFIKSIETDCGSHTHTLVPDGNRLYIYVSSYGLTTGSLGPNCAQLHGKISVIEVDQRRPWRSDVVEEPRVNVPVFEGTARLGIPGLLNTTGCHDITVLVPNELAAAACLSVGQLWDTRNPLRPQVIHQFNTPSVQAWHSSSFTWDGDRVAFGDEAGGGVLGRCREEDYPDTGAIWIFDVDTGAQLGSYKIPRFFGEDDHCTMHNYNFVPGVDRDILVSASYHGGTTVADVTNPRNTRELGWYEAFGPHASTWSSYWHNGFIYASDIERGFDVFSIDHRSVRGAAQLNRDNPQTQERLFR
jgi:hypothetical protein